MRHDAISYKDARALENAIYTCALCVKVGKEITQLLGRGEALWGAAVVLEKSDHRVVIQIDVSGATRHNGGVHWHVGNVRAHGIR
jgi:hypothetical protein